MTSTQDFRPPRATPRRALLQGLSAVTGAGLLTAAGTAAAPAAAGAPTATPPPRPAGQARRRLTAATGRSAPDERLQGPPRTRSGPTATRSGPTRTPAAQVPPAPAAPTPPATEGLLPPDPLLHLLRRATYGATPALVAEARSLGARRWLEQQLDPGSIDDSACNGYLAAYPLLDLTPPEINAALPRHSWEAMEQLTAAHLVRAVWSRRQLFEVMTDFWSNHLNVTTPLTEGWDGKPLDDRAVIRKHALGRFSDMLQASARSPAMLRYLANASSGGSTPNENHGRELLELHTVGRSAGYTEADVRNSALALTGLSVREWWEPGLPPGTVGEFVFRWPWRYTGPLRVLDWSYPGGPHADGLEVAMSYLDHLAHHPATARNLATKLCVRFVSDTPPAALVDRLAATYLAADTAIVPVLRALFTSAEFAASIGQKVRRPYEDLVATLRVLRVLPVGGRRAASVAALVGEARKLGHAPLGWASPDGYPDVAAAWTGPATTLRRWNLHLALAQGRFRDGLTAPDLPSLLGPTAPATAAELLDRLAGALLAQPLRPHDRDVLLTFLGLSAGDPPARATDSTMLPFLVALLLDSAAWSLR